jgi:hypothetical protein
MIEASGLKRDLEEAAHLRAMDGNWFELPREKQGTGYK